MAHPDQNTINNLKAKHPDRSLHLVEIGDEDSKIVFVMTGPNLEEMDKLEDDMIKAGEVKIEAEKNRAYRAAIKRNALANIRWPDRDEVIRVFDANPLIIDKMFPELRNAAGASLEVRSKKL